MGTRGGGTPPSSTGSPAPTLYTPLLVILFLCTLKCTYRNSYVYCADPWSVDPTEFWWFIAKAQIKCIVAVDTEVSRYNSTSNMVLGKFI